MNLPGRSLFRACIFAAVTACGACSDSDASTESPTRGSEAGRGAAADATATAGRLAGPAAGVAAAAGRSAEVGAAPTSGAAGQGAGLSEGSVAAAPKDADPSALAALPVAPVQWSPCDGSYQCGSVTVPIDYSKPTDGTLTISLKRRRASGQRMGAVLINPGGPGQSGVSFVSSFEQMAPQLAQRFDIVGFDPRGVGRSSPIDCHSTVDALVAADPSPDSDAEWMQIDDVSRAFAEECGRKHAALLPHLGTVAVARDLDRIREALGESTLNYVGFSYGTVIGAHYADLFPRHVRALVLDGAVDLGLDNLALAREQAGGLELALQHYFDWCSASAARCRWSADDAPGAAFNALSAALDQKPAAAGSRSAGPGEFSLALVVTLFSGEPGWQALSASLDASRRGDGRALLQLADLLVRNPDGSVTNSMEMNQAVNALDRPVPTFEQVRAEADRIAAMSPHFGAPSLTGQLVLAHWPATSAQQRIPRGAGAPPLLVIGTTGDPSTPYAWATHVADQLESAVLLTFDGEGHTAFGRGNSCIDQAVGAYLMTLTVPPEGTRCAGNAASRAMADMVMMR